MTEFMKQLKLYITLGVITLLTISCGNTTEYPQVEALFDATVYADMSTSDLIYKLGEPTNVEDWNNETTKGTFQLTIYSYDDALNNHYEFIVDNVLDKVVRVTAYSSLYWTSQGSDFRYIFKSPRDLLALINIQSTYPVSTTDTGYAYIISNITDNIDDVQFAGIDENNFTFEIVKVTYNMDYFD